MQGRYGTALRAVIFALGALFIVGGLLGSMLSLAAGVDLWVTLLAVAYRGQFRTVPPFNRRASATLLAVLWLSFVGAEMGLLVPRVGPSGPVAAAQTMAVLSVDTAPPLRHTLTPGELAGASSH